MENTVGNNLNIIIKDEKKEDKEIFILSTKKRKCDDTIINSAKTRKHSDTMKNNCYKCNRRMNLVSSYKCRCGNNYCNRHRFHDQHDCKFDFKKLATEKLAMNNPKLQNNRIGDH
ncbi:zinc finger AN1 domain-containing protein [Vairimorpha necatrix]|uniref:Zinc finger AN1 domain-containing protein n=1 Tax=Vairimorpha necatrix TaxID=6039 RepID=A0AAX4J8T8_9MICR